MTYSFMIIVRDPKFINILFELVILHSITAINNKKKKTIKPTIDRYLMVGHTCHRPKVQTSNYSSVGPVVTTSLYSMSLNIGPIEFFICSVYCK